jgi:hypothetical protein
MKKAARTIQPFASSQLLQERFEAIALERPSDLNVSLARSLSKIHDWENLLKQPNLSAQDVSRILECCERIIAILSLRLNQETNDSIGSIYKIMKQSYGLTQRTVIKLLGQKDLDKKLYEESVKRLLAKGHYFSDYLALMGYLADLDIAKKYLYEDQKDGNGNGNGNGYSNGNGQAHKKISYSWWHKITAVPFLEKNAMRNLKLLLPRLNTEDNEFTPQEYFHNLKPTRIGSSRAWTIRKPVTVFTSLILSLVSLTLFLFATPLVSSPLLFIKGFLVFFGIISIPLMHYFFAYIGTVRQRKDLKKSHSQISNLEKKWRDFVPVTRPGIPPNVPPSAPVQGAQIEEDHALGGIDLRTCTAARNIGLSAAADELFNDGAEQEMIQINRLIKAKIIPSSERLRECLSRVPASGQERYLKQMNNFLAEIFMLEEEYGQPSETSFVNLLQTVVLNK